VKNPVDETINISSIYLANGSKSNFRINIDGISSFKANNIELAPKDSLYIFVEVTVDPTNQNTPLLITDSIVFENNGKIQDVDLVAYGQDAYFILPNKFVDGLPPYRIIAGENVDTVWNSTKPIVIYGYAVVDSAASLRIEEGTQIHFHNNSGLWVYIGGKIEVLGTTANPVVFQGDRPESFYDDHPGQWDRIWINESQQDHIIENAIIKNAFIGLQLEHLRSNYGNKITIKNTIIENMLGAGILSRNYSIEGENLLVTNCEQYCVALTLGGSYSFKHSTFANYWNYGVRNTPSVYINNFFQNPDNSISGFDLLKADFENCIIYGNNSWELFADSVANTTFNYYFDHCIIKTDSSTTGLHFNNIFRNINPEFEDYYEGDFHLKDISPAIGVGKAGVLNFDLEGNPRDASNPDLGAYEYTP
jgi:hypothetical protein